MIARVLARTTCVALLAASSLAIAQMVKPDFGQREYNASCAACHGMKGAGDGPYVEYLRKAPPDLTVLARANGGIFPYARVYQTIDGRIEAGHGPREMRVWGTDYAMAAAAEHIDVPYEAEPYIRVRITALLDYIHRLQR
jgi:mono/diheme cytochrome c family protein